MNSINEVGSIFRIQDKALASERFMLLLLAGGFLLLLFAFVAFAWRVGSTQALVKFSNWANGRYFVRYRFIALTVLSIAIAMGRETAPRQRCGGGAVSESRLTSAGGARG